MFINEIRMEVLPYMTASYVLSMFNVLQERPISVTIRRNKYGASDGAIVCFPNNDIARHVVVRLNGKFLPDNNHPPFRFNLIQGLRAVHPEYCLWVTDLTADVDDYQLYKFFNTQYDSVFYAKVAKDASSAGNVQYGYIKFGREEQQKQCLQNSNGATGLGGKKIKLSLTSPNNAGSANKSESQSPSVQNGNISAPKDTSFVKSVNMKDLLSKCSDTYLEWNKLNVNSHEDVYIPNIKLPYNNIFISEDRTKLIEYNISDHDKSDYDLFEQDFNTYDNAESLQWLPVPVMSPNVNLYNNRKVKKLSISS